MKRPTVDEALRVLEVGRDATWDEIRSAYRDSVRSVHPDINTSQVNNNLVISLNEAYATLVAVTNNGKKPIPVEESPLQQEQDAKSVVRFSDNADPFDLILDMSHDVGDVIYVSEEEGLVQVLIDAGKRTESILLAQIDNSVLPIQVLFTLELQSGDQPLDIVNLVSKFGDFEAI